MAAHGGNKMPQWAVLGGGAAAVASVAVLGRSFWRRWSLSQGAMAGVATSKEVVRAAVLTISDTVRIQFHDKKEVRVIVQLWKEQRNGIIAFSHRTRIVQEHGWAQQSADAKVAHLYLLVLRHVSAYICLDEVAGGAPPQGVACLCHACSVYKLCCKGAGSIPEGEV